jgi:hypothetical protein
MTRGHGRRNGAPCRALGAASGLLSKMSARLSPRTSGINAPRSSSSRIRSAWRDRRVAVVFLAQWMRRLVQFFRVIRNDIALLCRQFSRPEGKADQAFAHPHKVFDFCSHDRANVQVKGSP